MPKELPEKLEEATITDVKSLIDERLAEIEVQSKIRDAASEKITALKLEVEKLQNEGQIKLGIKVRVIERNPATGEEIGEGGDKPVDSVDNPKGKGVE